MLDKASSRIKNPIAVKRLAIALLAFIIIISIVSNLGHEPDYSDDESQLPYEYDDDYEEESIYAEASSYLEPVDDLTYYPENAMDDEMATAWVEGAEGNGEGEWLTIPTNDYDEIAAIRIVNGYQKSEDFYYKNNRVKEAELIFDDGTSELVTLNDEYGKSQIIILSEYKNSDSVTLRINSVYPGDEWQDTCITEMSVAEAAAGANVIVLHSEPN